MKKIILLITGLILSTLSFSQTTISDSIISGGVYRTYMLYIPAIYNSADPVPLVFNLHAYGYTNTDEETYADFRPIADTANFIIALPQGDSVQQAWEYNLGWDNFNSVADAQKDLDFISNLIDSIKTQYNIDLNRVYSCGYSNGGFMSYDLACYLNSRIAAVASVAGTMIISHDSLCNPAHPTPIMEIHGAADSCVTYNGVAAQCLTLQVIHCLPIDTLVKRWVDRNNCSTTPVFTNVPNTNLLDFCTAEHYVYNGGNNGSSVELFKINGGSHTWPGSGFIWGSGTCMDFNASVEIWRFFRQYTLTGLTTDANETDAPAQNLFSLFPNPSQGNFTLAVNCVPAQILITNSLGQVIQLTKVDKTTNVDFTIIDKGIFFLQLTNAKETVVKKIVVSD
jgi:polyhydroxybutyrate depolymerase